MKNSELCVLKCKVKGESKSAANQSIHNVILKDNQKHNNLNCNTVNKNYCKDRHGKIASNSNSF